MENVAVIVECLFSYPASFGKFRPLVEAIHRKHESPLRVPET
jgi:hypothetical protein